MPQCIDIDFGQSLTMERHWEAGSACFTDTFVNNLFGQKCKLRDHLWLNIEFTLSVPTRYTDTPGFYTYGLAHW